VDSAQQIIAEVGPTAATFPSEKCLSSWMGACPGDDESAAVNYSHRPPNGNRHMRRVLNQCANAAAKAKGTIFDIVYRRSVPCLGHNQAIGAIAHRQCRLDVSQKSKQARTTRTTRMIGQLRRLGYRIEPPQDQHSSSAQVQ
jgi:transposase